MKHELDRYIQTDGMGDRVGYSVFEGVENHLAGPFEKRADAERWMRENQPSLGRHEAVPQQDAVHLSSFQDGVELSQNPYGKGESTIYLIGKANVLALIDVLTKAAEEMS